MHYDCKQDLYERAIARYQHRLAEPDGPLLGALLQTRFPLEIRPVAGAIRSLIAENGVDEAGALDALEAVHQGGAHGHGGGAALA